MYQKADNPAKAFAEYLSEKKDRKTTPTVDQLPQQQRDWLRAT